MIDKSFVSLVAAGFFPLVVNQKGFQTSPDKLVDGLLNPAPVRAFVFQHHSVDRKAAVHLKPENSLRLLKGQEAFLHQLRDEAFPACIREFLQHPGGNHVIGKEYLVPGRRLYLFTERVGTVLFIRA